MHACLNPVTANLPDPEDYVRLAARSGFDSVDGSAAQWHDWVTRTSLAHVEDLCTEMGCKIGHGGLPTNFREDEDAFEADLGQLAAIAATSKAFGTRGMATWIAPTTGGDVAEFRAMHVRRLRKVAAILKDAGLWLGLEFVGPKTSRAKGNAFVCDMPGMLALCDEIDPESCGLLLDSYHWYTSHGTVDDILALESRQVVHVHINDAYAGPIDELMDLKRLLPGEGVIDLDAFLTSLAKIGYDGPVAVETFSEELKRIGPQEAARRAGEAMRAVMDCLQ